MSIHDVVHDWWPSLSMAGTGVPTLVAADALEGVSPTVAKIATALGTALTVFAFVWPALRKLFTTMKASDEKTKVVREETKAMREELLANTEMTQRLLTTNSRLQNTLLEQQDVREMLHEFRGEMVGMREDVAAVRENVKITFESLMDDYKGLGDLARGVKGRLEKMEEEWKVLDIKTWRESIDERLKKADAELEALRKTGTEH